MARASSALRLLGAGLLLRAASRVLRAAARRLCAAGLRAAFDRFRLPAALKGARLGRGIGGAPPPRRVAPSAELVLHDDALVPVHAGFDPVLVHAALRREQADDLEAPLCAGYVAARQNAHRLPRFELVIGHIAFPSRA